MTKIKRKKNKLIFFILLVMFFQSQISNLYSNDIKCKKLDIKCKTNKFIDNTGYTLNNFHDDQFEVQL